MARMSNRTARIVKWSALPAALIVSGLLVSQASYSAFSATTTNPTNSWNSGAIVLSNSSPATALFTATNIKPGDWGSKCITVTADKIVSGTTVKMQAKTAAAVGSKSELNDALFVKVTTPAVACTVSTTPIATTAGVTLTSFIATSGVPVWTPTAAAETKSYLIDWVFDPTATSAAFASKSSSIDFIWTADQGVGSQINP